MKMRISEIRVGERIRKDFAGVPALAESMAALGLLQAVGVTPNKRLLWGVSRLKAAQSLGWAEIEVVVRDVDPGDFVAVEAAENNCRCSFSLSEQVEMARRLEPHERAKAAARMKAGTPSPNLGKGRAADKVAAATGGVGRTTLAKAEEVVQAAEAEPERFGRLVADMDRTGRADGVHKQLRIARKRDEYEARREVGCTVADLRALIADGFKASVIYADPPWVYELLGDSGRLRTSAEHFYDTMTLDEICLLGEVVRQLAADDCALFLWVTWPRLLANSYQPGIQPVLDAWGFEYSSCAFVWEKTVMPGEDGEEKLFIGNGFMTRSNSEPCLYASKGEPYRLDMGVPQIVKAPSLKHSAKPEEAAERIEKLLAGPYLELFARRQRPGWHCWGDEIARADFRAAAE